MKEINLGFSQKVWKAFKFELWRGAYCALAHCRCKSAVENFDLHVTQTLCKNYSRQDFVQDSCALESIGISSIQVQCWPDSESGRETILGSDSSSEFPRSGTSLMAGKKTGLLQFSSKHSTLWCVFHKFRIAGAGCRWFSRPRRLKKRPRQKSGRPL